MSTIYAQNLIDRTLSRFGPPIVAAIIVLERQDNFDLALFVLISMLLVDAILRGRRYPLHLVPLARYMLSVLVPVSGIALAYGLSQLNASSLAAPTTFVAMVGASTTSLLALWVGDRFAIERPIRTAVIGDSGFALRLRAELLENRIRSYQLIGYVDESPTEDNEAVERDGERALPRLGGMPEIRSVVLDNQVDLLVVSPEQPRLSIFEQTAKACLDLPVRMIEATALYESVLGHVPIGAINSAWFQYIMHPLYSPSSPISKRVLDVVVSSALLVVAAPLMILCALAVKLEDRGPVLYRQRRYGEEGREFDMIKFRTLRDDADQLLAEGRSEEEVVTRAGRLLRKGHLNELPQLLQVLHGEMSLVGPRPEPPELVETLSQVVPHYDRRALIKPGLTGWAQVRCGYAGSRIGTAWKTCHDLYYLKHRSVGLDLVILLQTFHALVEREDTEQVPAPDFILGDSAELITR
jgi:lipopolysaccharide/colanic/teichoic acid biosynthesis glycosyltransferase